MNQILGRAIVDSKEFTIFTKDIWKRYQEVGYYNEGNIREEIIDSWENSKKLGISPFQNKIHEIIKQSDLDDRFQKNEQLLSIVTPKIESLAELLNDSKTMLSITDKHGTVLHSSGEKTVLKNAERINIFTGGTWSEKSAGTNAVGMVLRTKKPSRVLFSEHFCEKNHDWYCVAFPILEPFTNELVGIMNIAGNYNQVHQHTVGLVLSEATNISKSIDQQYYKYILRNHLFLHTAMESVEDAILVVDSEKKVVEKNGVAKSQLIFNNLQTIKSLPQLDRLADFVLQHGKIIRKEEVHDELNKRTFSCSIYPVTFQDEHLGAVIFLTESLVCTSPKKQQLETVRSANAKSTRYSFADMIGSSPEYKEVVKKARKAALIDATLFLAGETGTGKEVFAQAIHQASDRSHQPFVAINCGAIPHSLFESELFGYESGAFTGAKSKGNPGKFEMAQRGTIFLDEIADMPLDLQVHLLRILEERVVTRIGGAKTIPIDVRVIAATHKDLHEAVKNGTFREDLLYRLRVIQLKIPALRERIFDVPALVHHFVQKMSGQFGKQEIVVHEDTMEYLTQYTWPGNIRELKNVIQQSLFNMEGNIMFPFDLPAEVIENVGENEKERIIEAMIRENGNVTKAAKVLHISRATMYRKIKQYHLSAEDWIDGK